MPIERRPRDCVRPGCCQSSTDKTGRRRRTGRPHTTSEIDSIDRYVRQSVAHGNRDAIVAIQRRDMGCRCSERRIMLGVGRRKATQDVRPEESERSRHDIGALGQPYLGPRLNTGEPIGNAAECIVKADAGAAIWWAASTVGKACTDVVDSSNGEKVTRLNARRGRQIGEVQRASRCAGGYDKRQAARGIRCERCLCCAHEDCAANAIEVLSRRNHRVTRESAMTVESDNRRCVFNN